MTESQITAPPVRPGDLQRFHQDAPPRWPLVIGILAVIWGGITLLGSLISVITTLVMTQPLGGSGEDSAAGAGGAAMLNFMQGPIWTTFSTVTNVAAGVLLIAGGIGLIRLRRWSVTALKVWAWVSIAMVVLGVVFAIIAFDAIMATAMPPDQPPPPFGAGMMTAIIIGSMAIGFLFGLAVPSAVLIWFQRQTVRAQIATWN